MATANTEAMTMPVHRQAQRQQQQQLFPSLFVNQTRVASSTVKVTQLGHSALDFDAIDMSAKDTVNFSYDEHHRASLVDFHQHPRSTDSATFGEIASVPATSATAGSALSPFSPPMPASPRSSTRFSGGSSAQAPTMWPNTHIHVNSDPSIHGCMASGVGMGTSNTEALMAFNPDVGRASQLPSNRAPSTMVQSNTVTSNMIPFPSPNAPHGGADISPMGPTLGSHTEIHRDRGMHTAVIPATNTNQTTREQMDIGSAPRQAFDWLLQPIQECNTCQNHNSHQTCTMQNDFACHLNCHDLEPLPFSPSHDLDTDSDQQRHDATHSFQSETTANTLGASSAHPFEFLLPTCESRSHSHSHNSSSSSSHSHIHRQSTPGGTAGVANDMQPHSPPTCFNKRTPMSPFDMSQTGDLIAATVSTCSTQGPPQASDEISSFQRGLGNDMDTNNIGDHGAISTQQYVSPFDIIIDDDRSTSTKRRTSSRAPCSASLPEQAASKRRRISPSPILQQRPILLEMLASIDFPSLILPQWVGTEQLDKPSQIQEYASLKGDCDADTDTHDDLLGQDYGAAAAECASGVDHLKNGHVKDDRHGTTNANATGACLVTGNVEDGNDQLCGTNQFTQCGRTKLDDITDDATDSTSNSSNSHEKSQSPSPSSSPSRLQPQSYLPAQRQARCKQETRWNTRYTELYQFREKYGHCSVPHCYDDNIQLAQWVKRQRNQYKLKADGRHSTLTADREAALDSIGFVWDSHYALWEERFQDLLKYKEEHGHCNVPARYTVNRLLAIWVKCQRRQCKLLRSRKRSNMTEERIDRLDAVGFCWHIRNVKQAE